MKHPKPRRQRTPERAAALQRLVDSYVEAGLLVVAGVDENGKTVYLPASTQKGDSREVTR